VNGEAVVWGGSQDRSFTFTPTELGTVDLRIEVVDNEGMRTAFSKTFLVVPEPASATLGIGAAACFVVGIYGKGRTKTMGIRKRCQSANGATV
jgi:hypothetical protein